MAIHSIQIGNNIAEEINLKNKLKIGEKTYDGSAEITITASDLGLAAAMKFLGTSATAITDGATTNPITIGSTSTTVTSGNVVLYGSKEFVWTGSAWEELGNEGSYKVVQIAVSDPTASGNATAFIDSISQDTNGKITATKKNVNFPTTLPANGGNADTVDNKHAADFATAAQGTKADNALPKSGGTITGTLGINGLTTQGSPSSDSSVSSMNRFQADLFVQGSGAAPNGPTVAGFYLGKSASDENRHMDIVSGGDFSYIDFNKAGRGEDYDARLLVNVTDGSTSFMWGSNSALTQKVFDVQGQLRQYGQNIALASQIPTVNNGTLTIQKNGANVATFTANQSGNSTANITVPTSASDIGASTVSHVFTITLLASSWSSKTQTITNSKFIASGYSYIISPASNSFGAYVESQIYASDITTDGRAVFNCSTVPTTDLVVNVTRMEAVE